MSKAYLPRPEAEPDGHLSTVLLSQRDLGLRIPINYVTEPGVSLAAACFAWRRYEDADSGDCLSNLIAAGFRRIELDLFWDEGRRVWSFCPVAISDAVPNVVPSSSLIGSSISLGAFSITPTTSQRTSNPSTISAAELSARQDTLSVTSGSSTIQDATSTTTAAASGTSLGDASPSYSVVPDSPNAPTISLGPYACTNTINLSAFTSQIFDYISQTENTLAAHLMYVTINLHSAASGTSPSSPASEPSSLPSPSELIGTIFAGAFANFIYTPADLDAQRTNLNSSWYTVTERFRPVEGYYDTSTNQNGIVSTEDGWPSEGYIEFSRSKRILLSWGTIDPQMSRYNFSGDSGIVFEPGYIGKNQTSIKANREGGITRGCFLQEGPNELSQVNSSWAVTSAVEDFDYPTGSRSNLQAFFNLTRNLTSCGVSTLLNQTLLNLTAHNNFIPYRDFSEATIWSWAPGEPRNGSSSLDRCATTSPETGLWSVSDCSDKYPAACRAASQPYNWTITNYDISYSYARQACPDDYEFAVPRTALENSYLSQRIRDGMRGGGEGVEDDGMSGGRVWIDFNALDLQTCWVTGGPNSTCPYNGAVINDEEMTRRVILVPTIAAIIVLVIFALTVFVKCAGNRKVRKRTKNRTRRADNGFVYEGVPS